MRALATAALVLVLAAPSPARAGPPRDVGDELSAAADALKEGEFSRAAELSGAVARELGKARDPQVEAEDPDAAPRSDRAEAWRIYGLALFFEGDVDRAEAALLEYLKLEEDARLDPVLVPPEAILFFEDVRSRHAAEIQAYHPDPEPRRWLLLNLAPPGGQFQNGHRGKGWAIAATGVALVGLNIGSYVALQDLCQDNQCEPFGRARAWSAVNVASLVGLGGLYVYSAIDGFAGYRAHSRALSVSLAPGGWTGLAISGRF